MRRPERLRGVVHCISHADASFHLALPLSSCSSPFALPARACLAHSCQLSPCHLPGIFVRTKKAHLSQNFAKVPPKVADRSST